MSKDWWALQYSDIYLFIYLGLCDLQKPHTFKYVEKSKIGQDAHSTQWYI